MLPFPVTDEGFQCVSWDTAAESKGRANELIECVLEVRSCARCGHLSPA